MRCFDCFQYHKTGRMDRRGRRRGAFLAAAAISQADFSIPRASAIAVNRLAISAFCML